MSEKKDLSLVHMIVMLLLVFGVRFLPPFGEMTVEGMQVLGVFVGVIYGWVTMNGLLLPSVVGITAMLYSPAINGAEFLASAFGTQTFLMVLCMTILAALMIEKDLSNVIVTWMMNLKIAKGRPWVVMTFFFVISFIMGVFGINLLALLILVPMYISMAKKANLPVYHPLNYAFIVGLLYCSVMGSCSLPFSAYVIVMLNTFSASTGALVDLGRYTFVVFPMTVVLTALYIIICKYVFRIDVSALRSADVASNRMTVSKSQKWSLFMLFAVIMLLTLSSVLPQTMWLGQFLSTMGYGGISIGVLTIMMLAKVEGEPLLNFGKTAKNINWDVLMSTAFIMPMASLLGADNIGIKASIDAWLQPLVSHMSPLVLVIFIVLTTGILTNFLNNMVVAVIFISVLSVMGDSLGNINMISVAVLIILASSCAFVLPSGNPVTAFAFSYKDLVKTKDLIKFSFIVFVILMIVICSVCYVYLTVLM